MITSKWYIRAQHHTGWYWKSFSRTCCLLRDPSICLCTASASHLFQNCHSLPHRPHCKKDSDLLKVEYSVVTCSYQWLSPSLFWKTNNQTTKQNLQQTLKNIMYHTIWQWKGNPGLVYSKKWRIKCIQVFIFPPWSVRVQNQFYWQNLHEREVFI